MALAESIQRAFVQRIQHRAVVQDQAHAGQRTIAVLRSAATHTAGVIGGDAADHGRVDRSGIRSDFFGIGQENLVGHAAHDSGLQFDLAAIVQDIDFFPSLVQQHQHRIRNSLPGQAGAGRAKRHGQFQGGALLQNLNDLGFGFCLDDQLRQQAVKAGICAKGENREIIM